VDNRPGRLVDNLPNVCSNDIRHAAFGITSWGCSCGLVALLTIPRRQLQRGPDSPPDGLARDAVSQRLNNGALAQRREAVLRSPHAEVTGTEM
jgi:hypothetical protein